MKNNDVVVAEIKPSCKSGGVCFEQYIYLNTQPIAKLEKKTIYAIHSDHLGTPRQMIRKKQFGKQTTLPLVKQR
ncbi:MAG: hypothetical protein V3U87_13930 [Methylococcaceae bacterium]